MSQFSSACHATGHYFSLLHITSCYITSHLHSTKLDWAPSRQHTTVKSRVDSVANMLTYEHTYGGCSRIRIHDMTQRDATRHNAPHCIILAKFAYSMSTADLHRIHDLHRIVVRVFACGYIQLHTAAYMFVHVRELHTLVAVHGVRA